MFEDEAMVAAINHVLDHHQYDARKDFIVLTGSINCVTQLVACAVNMSSDGIINSLMFSTRDNRYRHVKLG